MGRPSRLQLPSCIESQGVVRSMFPGVRWPARCNLLYTVSIAAWPEGLACRRAAERVCPHCPGVLSLRLRLPRSVACCSLLCSACALPGAWVAAWAPLEGFCPASTLMLARQERRTVCLVCRAEFLAQPSDVCFKRTAAAALPCGSGYSAGALAPAFLHILIVTCS